jgi:hypothetical protein
MVAAVSQKVRVENRFQRDLAWDFYLPLFGKATLSKALFALRLTRQGYFGGSSLGFESQGTQKGLT